MYLPRSCADMALRRLLYLTALEGCLVLYVFYREWMAWLLLLAVVCLPVFSLLISLPAMLTVKTSLHCPRKSLWGNWCVRRSSVPVFAGTGGALQAAGKAPHHRRSYHGEAGKSFGYRPLRRIGDHPGEDLGL